MYVGAENDSAGWVVRLFDQNGKQISPIVFRVSLENTTGAATEPLPLEIVDELMHKMRQQVMEREAAFVAQASPKKT
jgi:hypothetical protein